MTSAIRKNPPSDIGTEQLPNGDMLVHQKRSGKYQCIGKVKRLYPSFYRVYTLSGQHLGNAHTLSAAIDLLSRCEHA